MATPQPDPASSGGRSDPGPNLPEVPKKRPGQGVWTHKDGGPGPAEWRKQKGISPFSPHFTSLSQEPPPISNTNGAKEKLRNMT